MKILKNSNNEDDRFVKCVCLDCGCEFEVDLDEDESYIIRNKDYEVVSYFCPNCGKAVRNEDREVTPKNISYPEDFFTFGDSENAVHITDEEIQKWVREQVAKVKNVDLDDPNESNLAYTSSGDTFVGAIKYEDEIVVLVAKNYQEGVINL